MVYNIEVVSSDYNDSVPMGLFIRKVYDLTDLMGILRVSKRTLFKWKSEGRMKFSQIGKKIFVTDAELKRFLETNKNV